MIKILVVDDSFITRRSVVNILQKDGYVFTEAADGKIGLDKVANEKIDCMILDLLMPQMDGFAVLEKLNEVGYELPVIVLSADIQETVRKKCLDLNVFGFLNKPPREDDLRELVKKAIATREESSP